MTLLKKQANPPLQLITKHSRLKSFTYTLTREAKKEIELKRLKEKTRTPLERRIEKNKRKNKVRKNY